MFPEEQIHYRGHHQQWQGVGVKPQHNSVLYSPIYLYRCGSYPGLYTDVARYVDWITSMIALLENEIE